MDGLPLPQLAPCNTVVYNFVVQTVDDHARAARKALRFSPVQAGMSCMHVSFIESVIGMRPIKERKPTGKGLGTAKQGAMCHAMLASQHSH